MIRKPDWEYQLATIVAERDSMPFEWGVNDCCIFACDVIKRITAAEFDFAEGLRGHYKTQAGAYRIFKRHGVRNAEELIEEFQCFGFPSQPVMQAQRGDVMTATTPNSPGIAAGICIGPKSVFVGREGLIHLNTLSCRKSWRV